MEIIDVEDLFENDDIVVIKSRFKLLTSEFEKIDIGIKDENNDIVEMINVKVMQVAI